MEAVLYYNGIIIMMRGETAEQVEAVLAADGKIIAAGTTEAVNAVRAAEGFNPEAVLMRDLNGTFMMPAFMDSHSHITAVMQVFGYENLNEVKSFDELLTQLESFKKRAKPAPGEWIIGIGYDHNFLIEQSHPDKFLLDRVFEENPEGGAIGRVQGTEEPDGYLEETAFTRAGSVMPKPDMKQLVKQFTMTEQLYLKHGITTV